MKRGHKKGNEKPKIMPDFIQIPYQVFSDEILSSTDKFVYGAIYFFYNTTAGKKCTASNKTIGDLIKTTASTVSNSLIILDENRYIKRVFFDETCRKRKEIIPLVVVTKLTKNRPKVKPQSETKLDKTNTPQSETNTPQSETNTPQSETPFLLKKESLNGLYKAENDQKVLKSVSPQSEEREKREKTREKNKEDYRGGPSDTPRIDSFDGPENFSQLVNEKKRYSFLSEVPEKDISTCISFFLPIFPDQFVTKNPFAVLPNRNAIRKVLMRLSLDEFKVIIDKYVSKKGDPFRPEASTIATFCNYKLDRVEAFVSKSAGNLWAQKSISTPEHSAMFNETAKKMAEERREKQRLLKEKWESEYKN